MAIDAVEFSPSVAKAATSCFAFPTSENVQLHVEDGISFLQTKQDLAYNWIVIDASGTQDRFATPDAHRLFSRLLGPKGLLTFNSAGFEEKPELVDQGLAVAKAFWKYAYKSANKHAWSFSNEDLSSVARDRSGVVEAKMLSRATEWIDSPHASRVAVSEWFGAGLSPLW